jgi:hypothetical protein
VELASNYGCELRAIGYIEIPETPPGDEPEPDDYQGLGRWRPRLEQREGITDGEESDWRRTPTDYTDIKK